MTNSAQLRNDAENLRKKAQAKNKEVDNSASRSAQFTASGDFDKAAVENQTAQKMRQEALDFEQTATTYDNQAAELESRAANLEKQKDDVQKRAQAEIEELDAQIKSLRGNSSWI